MLVEHLSDLDNDWPRFREHYAPLIGIKPVTLRKYLSSEEFADMESEALDNRRKSISRLSASVDSALLKAAKDGDVQAIKLWYQKLEGWNEKTAIDLQATGLEKWK